MSLKQQTITSVRGPVSSLYQTAIVGFLCLFFMSLYVTDMPGGENDQLGNLGLLAVPLLAILATVFSVAWYSHNFTVRQKRLAAYADQHTYRFQPDSSLAGDLEAGSLKQIHNASNPKVRNAMAGDGWNFCDFSYQIMRHTKYGDYVGSTVYYSVMEVELSRALPNLFFDSLRARHHQFRFEFARSQRLSLEGDFDKHFMTYSPMGYQIDSLSFISPEVMLALRDADDYDIEIYGNRLFLYGPLGEPSIQMDDMIAKIMRLKKELEDNIDTYRDERLPYDMGRKSVSVLGSSLERSRIWTILSAIALVIYLALMMISIFDGK